MRVTTGSRGQLRGQISGNCDDYGIDEGSVSIIIRTFMAIKNERADHTIDMGPGVLLFSLTQGDRGVIYVYSKRKRDFWGLSFDEGSDPNGNQYFTRDEFEALSTEYGLLDYAARPSLLEPLVAFDRA